MRSQRMIRITRWKCLFVCYLIEVVCLGIIHVLRDDSGGPFGGLIRLPPISVVAHLGRVVRGPSYISLNTFPSRIQTSPALPDWVMDIHSMVLTSSKVYEACCAVIRLYHLT